MLGHVFRRLRVITDGLPWVRRPVRPAPPPACPDGFLYAVGPGDRLSELAGRFRLSRGDLVKANPQVVDWGALAPGQLLCVPAGQPFTICLMLRPAPDAPAEAAGVVLARRTPQVGAEVLVAVTGVQDGELRLVRDGECYRTEPLGGGCIDLREPTGMLARFERLEVHSGGRLVLEGLGRDCLPARPESPLAPY